MPFQFLCNQMVLVPELHDPWVWNSRLHDTTWARPVSGKHRLPDDEHFKILRMILLQDSLCGGSPPQARRSSGREEQQQALVVCCTVKLLYKLGEIVLVHGCQRAPRRPPEIPADQQHRDECGKRQRVLGLRSFHVSPGKQAGDHLREKDDHKNDGSSYPQHRDTQRAAFLALLPPPI